LTPQTRHGSGQDWDDARKSALFADIVSLKLSIEEAAALHGLRVDVIQEWLRLFRRSALLAFDERLKKTLINQGANADALTAAEFTGHIEDVSIADLVQTIEIAGKDAVITVAHEGSDSRIWCSAGAIIDAESGRLSGESAVYRILGFERGRMVADLRPEPRVRTIYAATHRLLIEAVRRKDEASRLEQKLGRARFYRLGERSTSARVHVSTDELAILRLFDGPRRIGEVVVQCQLGDLESLTALQRLVTDGYLVETDGAPASRRPHRESSSLVDPPSEESEHVDAPARGEPTERVSRLEPHESSEAPSSPMSFVPMAVSQRPDGSRERAAPRWVFAALAAAVLAPAAFWFGETMSNLRATRRAPLAAAAPAARNGAPLTLAGSAPVPSFSVSTTIEPANASIWLDRHPVARGYLNIQLAKDGTTHELRVAADGFIPITLLFADVPPPRSIRLEPLPVLQPVLQPSPPASEPASPVAADPQAAKAAASTTAKQASTEPAAPLKPSANPAPAGTTRPAALNPAPTLPASALRNPAAPSAPARTRVPPRAPRAAPRAAVAAPKPASETPPKVQLIETQEPRVRVIE
jgi:hypothetical protein